MTPSRPIWPSCFTTSMGNSEALSQRRTLGAISRAAKSRISRRRASWSSVRVKGYVEGEAAGADWAAVVIGARKFLEMRKPGRVAGRQGRGNREQGTGNRQQGTGNRQQGTGNREQAIGNRQQATGRHAASHLSSGRGGVTGSSDWQKLPTSVTMRKRFDTDADAQCQSNRRTRRLRELEDQK